jgi:hypothetical protein
MKRIKYKKFAGVRIKGKVPLEKPEGLDRLYHLNRVEWLTAMVESGGVFGTVQNYDGTGMTAGLHQAIACYPRAQGQGPLWDLLRQIGMLAPIGRRPELLDMLFVAGIWCDNEGTWRKEDRKLGRLRIREEFTGSKEGVIPLRGPGRERAEKWARLFHECFSDSVTFQLQQQAGADWLYKRLDQALGFSRKHKKTTVRDAVYDAALLGRVEVVDLGLEKDLALAVYWSHSVNAPNAALRRLCKAADEADPLDNPRDFAKALIRRLAKAKFGRWHYTVKNGRYQRTRRAARKLWPAEFFKGKGAIMPYRF